MLRAVPVDGFDVEEEEAFGFGWVVGVNKTIRKLWVISDIFDFTGCPNLQTLTGGEVDEEK